MLAALVLLALTLVTIDARSQGGGFLSDVREKVSDVFSPLQTATHDALRPIGNFLTGALHYGSLERENQDLRRQLAQAANEQATAIAEQQEAEAVLHNQQLDGRFVGSVPSIEAPIIDIGSSNFDNTVTIGKGRASGLAVGEPVVAAGGLVGSVVSVSSTTATVELLTDPSFTVGVSLQGGNTGSATGGGRTQPMKIQVDSTANPKPLEKVGEILVTSGLEDEKFPPAIPVGRISSVTLAPAAIEPNLEIEPVVDTARLSFVQVMLWSPEVP